MAAYWEKTKMKVMVLGAGIAGLSAAYHLSQKGIPASVFEGQADWGGLCSNFTIDGFRFDKFVHFSFTEDKYVKNIFSAAPYTTHEPEMTNFYHGLWIKHPAQNNLQVLPLKDKFKILFSFILRPKTRITDTSTYEEWLRAQYGNYFAENFPMVYTEKYWGVPAAKMETKWVGNRMRNITLLEMLKGIFSRKQQSLYYAKKMRYPLTGGFKSFLYALGLGRDMSLYKKAVKIDSISKTVFFADNTFCTYESLISTIPLTEIIKILPKVPGNIIEAAKLLRYTRGYMVSVGLKNKNDFNKNLWFYAYDKDIPFSRVYFPANKSPNNVPEGCSSLQAEIFFANNATVPPSDEILDKTIKGLLKTGLIKKDDILFTDIRFEPYANIIFDSNIYTARKIILDYLKTLGIYSAGRFGKWDYFWTDQAFMDGKTTAEELLFKRETKA